MRVTREQAEQNRRAVVDAAGKLFRERGFDGVSLTELMGSVGLTQGGFYKQFQSKDELAVEACDRALEKGADAWKRAAAAAGTNAYAALVERYLTMRHRARVGDGCVFAALAADAARHGDALPRHVEAGMKTYVGILEDALPGAAPDAALAAFSTMVGALLLARAVDDDAYARRILDAASASLLGRGPAA